MAFDFKKEEEVKEYIKNLGIEYRYGCYSEQKPEVCHLLGMYFDVIKKNTEQAKKIYKVNCDTHNWSYSCYKYAYFIDKNKKPEQVDEVIDYFLRGCESGLPKSCYFASVRMGAKAEKNADLPDRNSLLSKSLELMNRACDDELGRACYNLSSIYYHGIPEINVKKNLQKVLEYSLKGCEHQHINACANASLMYLKGEGTEKNEELAKKYRQRASELHKQLTTEGLKFGETP